jgi:hypothetical protein
MWCEIHHTTEKRSVKMLVKPAAQEPRQGEHHCINPTNDDQMDEINVIFRDILSIASKTQGKKLEREISLA